MSTLEVMFHALTYAFVITNYLVPELRRSLLKFVEWLADRKKAMVPKDDNWGDVVGEINRDLGFIQAFIINAPMKPFSCMQCTTFWLSLAFAWCNGTGHIMFV